MTANPPLTARRALLVLALGATALSLACASGQPRLPPARPVVNSEGLRISPSMARMDAVAAWISPQLTHIAEDPGFLISAQIVDEPLYPWETIRVTRNERQDTVIIAVDDLGTDAMTAYELYAHLHLVADRGELAQWLPSAEGLEGLDLEEAILRRVGEAWLYGRSVFSTIAHPVWDEIMFSSEYGYLRPLVLVARPEEFQEEKAAFEEANPEALGAYAEWFRASFDREPPGLRPRDAVRAQQPDSAAVARPDTAGAVPPDASRVR